MTTGIGFGLAIPHASTELVSTLQTGFFNCPKGVNWDALDNAPVTLIACFLVPQGQLNRHLHTLAKVAKCFHHSAFNQAAGRVQTPEDWRHVILRFLPDE